MSTNPSLDIVIVNWNSENQLRECIDSINATDRRNFSLEKIVVVDNDSSDGSYEGLREKDLPVTLIKNPFNYGFSRACNQGAAIGTADTLLFLNPDIRLFENSLKEPLDFLSRPENAKAGIVGIRLEDENGTTWRSCARFPKPGTMFFQMLGLDRMFPQKYHGHFMTDWNHRTTRTVDQVMGAFFLVRRNLFERLSGFDERFFVYFEDLDFSLRAKRAGYKSWFLAEASAYHKGCGTSEQVVPQRLFYHLKSKIMYGFKHFGRKQGVSLMVATLLCESITRLIYALFKGSATTFMDTLKAFGMLIRDTPASMQKGNKI